MTLLTGKRGFTLIELLVVIGVMGLLMFVSVPAMTNYATQARLKTTTRQLVGVLSLARHQAISARQPRTVLIDPSGGAIAIEETLEDAEPRRFRLPTAVIVEVVDSGGSVSEAPWRIVFQSSGALAGRTVNVVVANRDHSQTIIVASATGAVIVR